MKKLTLWLYVGLCLRLINSFINGFFGPSFDAGGDAFWFHVAAAEYSKHLVLDSFVTGSIYSYILGIFYFVTTDSLFLGSVLSSLGWFISAVLLVRIMTILSFGRSIQWKIMLIYAVLPSSLMYTSVTLREPFQLLFMNLAIYSACKIYCHKSAIYWVMLIFSIFCMGALHGALLATGVLVVIGTLFLLAFRHRKGISAFKLVLVTPVIIFCLYYGFLLFVTFSYKSVLLDGGLSAAVQGYQEASMSYEGRATYRTDLDISGMSGLLSVLPGFLFQYLFEPMPWHMTSVVDVVALLENVLRFWLILNALKYLRFSYVGKSKFVNSNVFEHRRLILFIFLIFLASELIWSLGTTNWGTGIRHHLPTIGLLLVTGFACQNSCNMGLSKLQKP
jgi:hypothetical protein